jgi:tetratricopeptide (TPR) repeat protein
MYLIVLLLAASTVFADDQAVLSRARTDFDRIRTTATPSLGDVLACVQAEAAALPVAPAEDVPLMHYRKGYCTLIEGALRRDAAEEHRAAGEFENAVKTWPEARGPAPAILRVLSAIALLKAGPDSGDLAKLDAELAVSADGGGCAAGAIPALECQSALETGRLWRGWIAERQGHLEEAGRIFQEFPNSGWPLWIAGRQSMEARRYTEAVSSLERAVSAWTAAEKYLSSALPHVLQPAADIPRALRELGEAQYLEGSYEAAITTLNTCLQREPHNPWTIFLRARSEDALGREPAAFSDYDLAGRAALAGSDARYASGDAGFYRAVSMFQRKDYANAEEEFATSLTAGPSPALQPDVIAWWRMTAVAGGSCQASAGLLEASLMTASDFFPKDQARDLIRACRDRARRADTKASRQTAMCYSSE